MADAHDERLDGPHATGRPERPRGATPAPGADVVRGNIERVAAKVKGLLRSEN